MNVKDNYILLALITAAAFGLRLFGLGSQPLTSDDCYFLYIAKSYVEEGYSGHLYWYHPPLRHILTYISTELFGYGAYAVRGASLVTGALSAPLTYVVIRKLTANENASLFAAFLMAFEQVHIVNSREVIGEPVTVFFLLAGVALFLIFQNREKPSMLVLSGLAFGLANASKFHAIPPLVFCLGAGLVRAARRRSVSEAAFVSASLGVLPFAVYLATFYPLFSRGYGMKEWIDIQTYMIQVMMQHMGTPVDLISQLSMKASEWFLKPSVYVEFFMFRGKPHVTLSFTNLTVWLLVLPSVIYSAWKVYFDARTSSEQKRGLQLLLAMFLLTYGPLITASRPVFLISSLSVLPFAFGCVGLMASDISNRMGKVVSYIFIVVVVLTSLLLYPMAIGKALDYGYTSKIADRFDPHRQGTFPDSYGSSPFPLPQSQNLK